MANVDQATYRITRTGAEGERGAAPLRLPLSGRLWLLPFTVLFIYSVTLLYIEATTSQHHVRLYFTDIGMPFKKGFFAEAGGDIGYGINTSLSSFLLGCAGLMMFFAAFAERQAMSRRSALFALQGAVFLYLSADDRLMLHERLGSALGTYSTVILMMVAAINAAIYLCFFRFSYFNFRMVCMFVTAVAFSGVMMFFDVLVPKEVPLRLSSEDLLKTWGGFFFLLFAWEAARFTLVGQARGEESYEPPESLVSLLPDRVQRLYYRRYR